MLHALNAKKAKLEVIVVGEKRQRREDLIASSLFGTTDFLTPMSRAKALSALTRAPVPESAQLHLWPRFSLGVGRWVEPDAVLEWTGGETVVYWVVEVKWGAPTQPNQIKREIDAVASAPSGVIKMHGKRRRTVLGFTFLGREPKHDADIEGFDKLRDPSFAFEILTWTSVTKALKDLRSEGDPGLKAWAETAELFLGQTAAGRVLQGWPTDLKPVARVSFDFV